MLHVVQEICWLQAAGAHHEQRHGTERVEQETLICDTVYQHRRHLVYASATSLPVSGRYRRGYKAEARHMAMFKH